MGSSELEVCIVLDAGRFSATRIEAIAGGWRIALKRAAESRALRLRVTASLVATHEISAGGDPFADTPSDEYRSADAIMNKGMELSAARCAGRLKPDDAQTFAGQLAIACGKSSPMVPPSDRRILAVYRQSFNYSGGSDENDIIQACAKVPPDRTTVLLIGRKVAGTEGPSVKLVSLAPQTLQSEQSVADHAWALLERHVGLRRDAAAATPAWSVSRRPADVALTCNSCGSTSLGGREGDHCVVCHMGHLFAVTTSRPAAATPASSVSPPAHRTPSAPMPRPTPSPPLPTRPVSGSSVTTPARPTSAAPSRPTAPPAPRPRPSAHPVRALALELRSAVLSLLGLLGWLAVRILGLILAVFILAAIRHCMKG